MKLNIELAKAMLVASHDYGYYRMNATVMNWLKHKDPVLASNNGTPIFRDAWHIRQQSYYQEIVWMAEKRNFKRIN